MCWTRKKIYSLVSVITNSCPDSCDERWKSINTNNLKYKQKDQVPNANSPNKGSDISQNESKRSSSCCTLTNKRHAICLRMGKWKAKQRINFLGLYTTHTHWTAIYYIYNSSVMAISIQQSNKRMGKKKKKKSNNTAQSICAHKITVTR